MLVTTDGGCLTIVATLSRRRSTVGHTYSVAREAGAPHLAKTVELEQRLARLEVSRTELADALSECRNALSILEKRFTRLQSQFDYLAVKVRF